MRILLATACFLLTTPAVANPVCGVIEGLAGLAMLYRQTDRSEAEARAQLRGTDFGSQLALAVVADLLVTDAYRQPLAAAPQRMDAVRDFRHHHHERCQRLTP